VTDPCGHVFHRKCFTGWANASYSKQPLARIKCPTCNKHTDKAIDIYLEVTGLNLESVSGEDDKSNVLNVKIKELSARLSGCAKEVAKLKHEARRVDELELEMKEAKMEITCERLNNETLKGELKKAENVANQKVENVRRQSTIVQQSLRSENSRLKTENEALLPMKQDMNRISADNQRMKRKLHEMESDMKKKGSADDQLLRYQVALKEAKDTIKRMQLRGVTNGDELKFENKSLKSRIKKLEAERQECVIEDVSVPKRKRHPSSMGDASMYGRRIVPQPDPARQVVKWAISQESSSVPPVEMTHALVAYEHSQKRAAVARDLWNKEKRGGLQHFTRVADKFKKTEEKQRVKGIESFFQKRNLKRS